MNRGCQENERKQPITKVLNKLRKRILSFNTILIPIVTEFAMINKVLQLSLFSHPTIIQPFFNTFVNLFILDNIRWNDLRDRGVRVMNMAFKLLILKLMKQKSQTGHKYVAISGIPTSCFLPSPELSGTSPE